MTRVSVALATFNGSRFLRAQLDSILLQTVPVDELVLGDDGSSDGSVDLVRRVWSEASITAPLVVLPVRDGNLGVARNFERILGATSGMIVLLSDQDDIWAPDRVARSLHEFERRPELDLLFGNAGLIDADGRPLGMTLFQALSVGDDERRELAGSDAFAALLRRNIATGATMAVRRAALDAALPVPDGWLHDEWLALRIALTGTVEMIPDRLIEYRQHGHNVIGVSKPTLRARVGRVLEPRGDRNRLLARRMKAFEQRIAQLDGVKPERADAVSAKTAFEVERAALPALRVARVSRVLRLAASGAYSRYASQGRLDVLRDLFQPP